jgi:predicted xylose isomerase-like sugar epimerase
MADGLSPTFAPNHMVAPTLDIPAFSRLAHDLGIGQAGRVSGIIIVRAVIADQYRQRKRMRA